VKLEQANSPTLVTLPPFWINCNRKLLLPREQDRNIFALRAKKSGKVSNKRSDTARFPSQNCLNVMGNQCYSRHVGNDNSRKDSVLWQAADDHVSCSTLQSSKGRIPPPMYPAN